MSLVYDDDSVRSPPGGGGGVSINSMDTPQVMSAWKKHAANREYLAFMARAGDFGERRQANHELQICDRKLKFWERHPAFSKKESADMLLQIKKEWARPPRRRRGDDVYGIRTARQDEIIREHVRGRRVVDLGCGSGEWLRILVEMGAAAAVGVDEATDAGGHVKYEHLDPDELRCDVACLFFPPAHAMRGLTQLLAAAPVVIYRGVNDDCMACGGWDVLSHLSMRVVLASDDGPGRSAPASPIPSMTARTSLAVYGGFSGVPRDLIPEESRMMEHLLMMPGVQSPPRLSQGETTPRWWLS